MIRLSKQLYLTTMNRIVFQIESAAKHLERSREVLVSQQCILQNASASFTAAEEDLKTKKTASEQAAKEFLRIFHKYEMAYQEHKYARSECDEMTIERAQTILSVVTKSKFDSLALLTDTNKFLEMAEEHLVEQREKYNFALLELDIMEKECTKAEDSFQKTVEEFNAIGGG
jgi:hypothetical protein